MHIILLDKTTKQLTTIRADFVTSRPHNKIQFFLYLQNKKASHLQLKFNNKTNVIDFAELVAIIKAKI